MNYNPKDHYFKKAKKENFVARSIFKLEEIDQKFRILKPGFKVLDLGASPGSWSQYSVKKVMPSGRVIAIDLNPMKVVPEGATFIQADLFQLEVDKSFQDLEIGQFDVILSDMAPKTTGIRITDQARSQALCELALQVSQKHLRKGGDFVCKYFHSDGFQELRDQLKASFNKVEALKPDSTRKISKEIFLIGLGKK